MKACLVVARSMVVVAIVLTFGWLNGPADVCRAAASSDETTAYLRTDNAWAVKIKKCDNVTVTEKASFDGLTLAPGIHAIEFSFMYARTGAYYYYKYNPFLLFEAEAGHKYKLRVDHVPKVTYSIFDETAGKQVDRNDREFLDRAIELNPSLMQARLMRGRALLKAQKYAEAITDYDEALKLEPAYAPLYRERAFARAWRKEYLSAIADLDKLIELEPEEGMAYYNRGHMHERLGNSEKATENFIKAARLGVERAKRILKDRQIEW